MKSAIKTCLRILAVILMLPFTLFFWVLSIVGDRDNAITTMSQLISLFPGKTGSFLRVGFYQMCLHHCEPNVVIGFNTIFSHYNTDIGAGCYIGPQCNIGKCAIGNECLIGSGVHIMSGKGQHNFTDVDTPLRNQGGQFQKVAIGENSWLGNGALIMANIGKNCVVAAGAVVVNDIPDYSIVAGNPAKVIKNINH